MHEPFFQVYDASLTASVFLQVSQNLSFCPGAFGVPFYCSDNFDSIYLVFVDLKALKSSAESAVTEMTDNFVLATADFFRAENHAFDPDKMTSVFAAINRPIVV